MQIAEIEPPARRANLDCRPVSRPRPLSADERAVLAVANDRAFTWRGDREHGLSRPASTRAINSLVRRGLLETSSSFGPGTYCATWPDDRIERTSLWDVPAEALAAYMDSATDEAVGS
jgi:hypothetical protein